MSSVESIFEELNFKCDKDNVYCQTIESILEAASHLKIHRRLELILAQPENEIIVHFPVRMDDGSFKLFKGYRVQHNNVLGPYKGGMRYDNSVHLNHIKALAAVMTMKCALFHLPLGGGKGGVQIDPRTLSQDELMRMTRRFTTALGDNIGPYIDIPAPDVGTNCQIMAWMADTRISFETKNKAAELSSVTGKPLSFGGSHGRGKATGQGIVYILEEMLPEYGLSAENCSFSVVGFGNVGSWTSKLLHEKGSVLKAVGDHTGFIGNAKGIDPLSLEKHVLKKGGIKGFSGAKAISEKEFYQTKVDLFIPAALEQMVDLEKAKWLDCKVIAEAANIPLQPQAEVYFEKKKIPILPAILCNAGGVIVSYFEMKQNQQAETWDPEVVDKRLKVTILRGAHRVKKYATKHQCDLRLAAYCEAIKRIDEVYSIRGIFP